MHSFRQPGTPGPQDSRQAVNIVSQTESESSKGPQIGLLELSVSLSCFRFYRALLSLTVFFKYGEEELIGEGVQAIGDEDAEAYIRQEVGVHVNPVITE